VATTSAAVIRVRAWTVVLTAATLTVGTMVIASAPVGAATTNVTVGPGDVSPGGSWASPTGSDTGTVGFVVGPGTPPLGSGSLSMGVASTSEHRSFYDYEFGSCAGSPTCVGPGTPLSSVNALGYSTYRNASSTQPSVVPTLNVEIDPDSTTTSGVNYSTLVWEPVANSLTVSDGVWQSWNAYNAGAGRWYSTADLTGYGVLECPAFTCSATWSQIVSNLPNAIIKYGLGPNAGSGWSGFSGNVDDLVVGIGASTKVFNFEVPPRISIGDTQIYEGDAGRRIARLMVSLDQAAPPGGVTAHWATHTGTAGSADFKGRGGNLYFKAGQTTRWAPILVNADTAVEGDEQFTVSLSSVVGATVTDGTGTVTIIDEEGGSAAALSIGSSAVTEGHSGGSRYVFLPVTLRGPVTSTVTVGYSTGGGTASSPDDYSGRSGTLVFTPKARERWVLVYLTADQLVEGNETFNVTLSSPVNATIAHGTGTVTVVDDD
jgi:Calx-beta domain